MYILKVLYIRGIRYPTKRHQNKQKLNKTKKKNKKKKKKKKNSGDHADTDTSMAVRTHRTSIL